ncbi:MAG: DUF222 domain-containing protein [Candidatus Nanopelagicales bacterium]
MTQSAVSTASAATAESVGVGHLGTCTTSSALMQVDELEAPGAAAIGLLATIDPSSLPEDERFILVKAWEEQASWVAAQQQRALAAAVQGSDEPCSVVSEPELTTAEVATRLHISHSGAWRRIEVATALTHRLPQAFVLLETGEWTLQHVGGLVDETQTLTDDQAKWVDAEVAAAWRAGRVQTPARIRALAKRACIAADTRAAELAHARAAETTTEVAHYPESDGMSTVAARLPAADAQVVWKALTAHGRKLRDEARRSAKLSEQGQEPSRRDLAYWRARALVDLSDQVLADPSATSFQGKRRVEVGVVVSLDTLTGLNDNPGELTGYGPIPAKLARELAGDAEWRRWVSEPVSGQLLDYGRTTYRPPQELVDFLVARDNTCTFVGCNIPAWRCDLDHAESWSSGGETAAWCMGAVCRSHHNDRTHGGWQVHRDKNGETQWTSPLGVVYSIPPRQVLPSFASDPPGKHSRSENESPDTTGQLPPTNGDQDVGPPVAPITEVELPDEPPF